MVIKWSQFSRENLQDFVKNSKIISPLNYVISLVEYVQYLTENPYLVKTLCYINGLEIRQLIFKKHKILYHIFYNQIYIISVVHSFQDLDKSLSFIKKFFK